MSGVMKTMDTMSVVMMSLIVVLMTRVVNDGAYYYDGCDDDDAVFFRSQVSWRDAALASETRQRQRSARGSADAATPEA